ncbi:hypothetical protein GLW20_01110 [Virgibacillus halodenitrificans]|nr:hypothetical protein [Virgibacillus halodenitrificans]
MKIYVKNDGGKMYEACQDDENTYTLKQKIKHLNSRLLKRELRINY